MNKVTVYITIGNSDDGLNQREWHEFCDDMVLEVVRVYSVHTFIHAYALPNSMYQNGIWCFEMDESRLSSLDLKLGEIAKRYRQDSIARAVVNDVKLVKARG